MNAAINRDSNGRAAATTRPTPAPVARIGVDPGAFESFYREHREAVKRFVARRVADPYLVADLTAEVFVAALQSARGYDARRGAPRAWLLGIARNVVATESRRAAHELSAEAAAAGAGRALLRADDLVELHERIDAEATARSLYQEMSRISARDRAVLELVALDGLSLREAAAALDISQVAARVRLHRARRRLQDQLVQLHTGLQATEVVQ
jgi:RNA polymerase sigma factor (sigma-70 family)